MVQQDLGWIQLLRRHPAVDRRRRAVPDVHATRRHIAYATLHFAHTLHRALQHALLLHIDYSLADLSRYTPETVQSRASCYTM